MVRFVIAAVLAAAGLVSAPSAQAGGNVQYSVVSDGSLLSVVYFDGLNDQKILNSVAAPWSTSVASVATYPLYGVTAQTQGTQVACQILVNGKVVDQKSAVGRYSVVNCSAV
jgi:hypothetical protein